MVPGRVPSADRRGRDRRLIKNSDRSIVVDNAKGILIVLVIWGHMIEPLVVQSRAVLFVYSVIYLFHMPAFAFLAGMYTRPATIRDAGRQAARRLLLPFLVFQALYWPAFAAFAPDKLGGPLTPTWILWFLVSLATWRVALPLVCRLPQPLAVSLVAAVAVGYVDDVGRALSLSRTLVFFPAFLAGHLYGHRLLEAAAAARAWIPLALLALMMLLAAQFDHAQTLPVLYGSTPYSALPTVLGNPAFDRLVVILASGLGIFGILALVPAGSGPLTWLGRRTMSVYLLHAVVTILVWSSPPYAAMRDDTVALGLTVLLSVILAFSLATLDGVVAKAMAVLAGCPKRQKNAPKTP